MNRSRHAGYIALITLFILSFPKKNFAQQIQFQNCLGEIVDCESENAAQRLAVAETAPSENYDLKYARLEWTIDPDTLFIRGAVTFYFQIVSEADKLFFDCSDTLNVDSIFFHQSKVNFYQQPGDILEIDFPNSLSEGSMDSLTIFYHGIPAGGGFGSFTKTSRATGNNIWTLSEPYGAKDWWPCKQTLDDKLDSIDVLITTPIGNLAGTAGLLIKTDTVGDWVTLHWKHRYPIAAYLIGISVAHFASFSTYVPDGDDSIEVLNYVFPDQLESAMISEQAVIGAMELYIQLFGEYPFKKEKYGHMQFGWGGGMEHQTMSSMTDFGYELIVHELAHQWFGDKVTLGSWRDIWLNEGFATYLTGLTYESSSHEKYWPIWKSQTVGNIVSLPNGSVYVDDTTSVNRIFSARLSYKKGAYLLHMLRWKLGDSAFFKGVRDYLSDPQLAYHYARTENLKAHLEAASGTDLTPFFNEWFYGQGFPSYQLLWSQDENNKVDIALYETTSDSSVKFFELPVPVRFKSGNDSMDVVLNDQFNGETFTAQLSFKADSVIIDPDLHLISAKNTDSKIPFNNQNFPVGIYPSLTNDQITLQNFDVQPHSGSIGMYDEGGRLIMRRNFSFSPEQTFQVVSLKNFSAGIYFLRIETDTGSFTQRIVKY